MKPTEVTEFIDELGAGVFAQKLGAILSEAAGATILFGDKGKKATIGINLTMQRVGENDQVIVSHKLSKSIPTKRGKKGEEDLTETPFFVGKGGVLSINPPKEDAHGQFQLSTVSDGDRAS